MSFAVLSGTSQKSFFCRNSMTTRSSKIFLSQWMIICTISSTENDENLAMLIWKLCIRSREMICFFSSFFEPFLPSCLISLARKSFSTSSSTPFFDSSWYFSSFSSAVRPCAAHTVELGESTLSQWRAFIFFFGRGPDNAIAPGALKEPLGRKPGRFIPGMGGGGGGGGMLPSPGIGGAPGIGGGGGIPGAPKPSLPGGGGGGGGGILALVPGI